MQQSVTEVGVASANLPPLPPPLPAQPGKLAGPRPLLGFVLDLLIAVAALLFLSVVTGALWAAVVLVQSSLQGGGTFEPQALLRTLGAPGPVAMIWMTLVSTGGAALLVYFWRRRASVAERAFSAQAARRVSTWGWIVAAALATFLFSTALTTLAQHFGMPPEPSNAALIEAAFTDSPWLLVLFAVLVAPAYEELLFRRVLFGRLWAAGRPWLGLLLSSAAFALMHEIPGTSGNSLQATAVLWATYAFMGAMFAGVYWRTGTLWAAWAAHALNNALALAVMVFAAGH